MSRKSLFLLLDIDNTLYNFDETGFGEEMMNGIFEFAETRLGLTHEEAVERSLRYGSSYGISLYGYVKEHGVDPKEYSDIIHNCSYDKLHYNEKLVQMLTRLQYRCSDEPFSVEVDKLQGHHDSASCVCDNKGSAQDACAETAARHHLYYFTNGSRMHARRILEPLGLKSIFSRPRQPSSPVNEPHRLDDTEGFDEALEWYGFSYEDQWRLTQPDIANKPMKPAFEAIFRAIDDEVALDEESLRASANSPHSPVAQVVAHRRQHLQPSNMVMVDDTIRNLESPLLLGWSAVWLAHNNLQLPAGSMYEEAWQQGRLKVIRHILELESAVDELSKLR